MKHTIYFILLSLFCLKAAAQIKRTDILGAYIFNFAKESSSEKQTQLATYNIVVVSDNKDVIAEFKQMASHIKINNKQIKLTVDKNATSNLSDACLVFISAEKSSLYIQIYNTTKNDQVLLVSENYTDKTIIMLNLYETTDHKIKFEMNKGNINARNIKISDQVLLMGGNIVDLTELYIHSQKKIQSSDTKILVIEDSLNILSDKLGKNQEKIKEQTKDLTKQKEIISNQKKEKQRLASDIANYKEQFNAQQKAYRQSEEKLRSSNDSLKQSRNKLQSFKQEIENNNKILLRQQDEILSNKEILTKKDQIIKTQREIVIFFIIGTTITLILFFLLLKSLRDKKKKNNQLKQQKEEISKQFQILEKNKNLIESIMDELSESNEELTTTLEENKRIQSQLIQSEKMASLGVLSAGIAHEINNPINFVYAGINSLLRDFEDIKPVIDEVCKLDMDKNNLKEKIEQIKKLKEENYFDEAIEAIPIIINDIKLGADRTAEIVKGLRNFTHMDKDLYEPLKIHEGLDTSLLLLKSKYKNRIEIIKDYHKDIPDLLCYPGKINQVFLNILANAVDSIVDHGKIWITTSRSDDFVSISIKDNGVGISEEIQDKIYDPFFTTKDVGSGTGLGLAITYRIINDHNGHIKVESVVNEGSNFIITLPLV